MIRTHNCAELNGKLAETKVKLAGWIDSFRAHGKITFVNLRDFYGVTQVVFDESFTDLKLRKESVIAVEGIVTKRPANMINKEMSTGDIELKATSFELLNDAKELPIDIDNANNTDDNKLKYRYLDLRRKEMQNNLKFRHDILMTIHEFMNANGFVHLETPMMLKSTPEGARDFVVPSRLHNGKFYALPQSPQLYKQLLMISGFDKYYQIARCMRDENLRQDRQPEFTQLDIEMNFVEEKDVMDITEKLMKELFKKHLSLKLKKFPVLSYDEAMNRYGCDKPDLRFDYELIDLTKIMHKLDLDFIKNAKLVKGILFDRELSRKKLKLLEEEAKVHHAKGLAYVKMVDDKLEGPMAKFMDDNIVKDLVKIGLKNGFTLMFVADTFDIANAAMSQVRNKLGKDFDLYKEKFSFAWVNNFPLFEWNSDFDRWDAKHHIFSMPTKETIGFLDSDPSKVYGNLYDLVLNGVELCSGSIRIHLPEIQEKMFSVIGVSKKEAYDKFGFLLEAYTYGGPPHGGIAPGFDRLVTLMLGLSDIRDVIAFPKNKQMESPMDGSPSLIDQSQLDELGISINKK